jgi:hypothetical protein
MLFVLLFVIFTLALPLSVEIYKKGSDNVVARSGKELAETKPVSLILYLPNKALGALGNFAKGSLILISLGTATFLVWKALSLILKLLFYFLG